MEFLTTFLLYFLLPLLVTYFSFSTKRPTNYPPGPFRWPFIGVLPSLIFGKSFTHTYMDYAKKYGKIYSVKLGYWDQIVVSDYEVAKAALSKEDWVDRPQWSFFHFYMKWRNAGIIFSNGHDWKVQRRFTLKHLRDFGFGKSSIESLILGEVKSLADEVLCSEKSEDSSDGHLPYRDAELDDALSAAVTNVIWWMMANKRVTKGDPEFEKLLDTINNSLVKFDMAKAFSYFPSLFHLMPRWLTGVSTMEQRRNHMYGYMQTVIDEHKATLDANEPRDLIDCYLIHREKLREAEDDDEDIFEDEKIAWTLADLFAAGAETTTTTLRWYFLYMISHPEVQKKVREEIDAVVGRDRLPTYEDKLKMPYTEASILEVWRHATITPFGIDRIAIKDTTLGQYTIPKGTLLATLLYGMHHDPETFDAPFVYKPERFITKDGDLEKSPRIMPFQAGKRQCLGEPLARMNAFLAVTYLLQNFEFAMIPGEVYDMTPKLRSEVIRAPRPYKLRAIRRTA